MAVQHQRITASTTATAVAATNSDAVQSLVLRNSGATDVVLGGTGVTATTGYTLAAGVALGRIEIAAGEQLFVIAATTGTLEVLRLGV